MTNKYDLTKIVFFTILFLLYIAYTIIGFIIIIDDYSQVKCNYLWIYSLLSLLIPVSIFIVQLCAVPFLLTDIKKLSCFFLLMVIFGGISVFNCITGSNIWIFALVSFIFQTLVSLAPIFIKLYTCLCHLKTPCCCVNTDYYVNEIEDDNEV